MRKSIISFIMGAAVMLVAIIILANLHAIEEVQEYTFYDYISNVEEENCFLCGAGKGNTSYTYWGEDNIGILNLNTFDLMYLEINRYDDFGNLIADQAGYTSTTGISDNKTGSSAHAFVFPDEGFARLQISDMQYKINRHTIQKNLCQACLDSFNKWSHEAPVAEYAVISFQERTIHPLTQRLPWFSVGNYGVDCEYGDEIKLLVHYFKNDN